MYSLDISNGKSHCCNGTFTVTVRPLYIAANKEYLTKIFTKLFSDMSIYDSLSYVVRNFHVNLLMFF